MKMHADLEPVTFVIPAFEAEDFIGEAISSVYNNFVAVKDKLIVIDDGSLDRTSRVVRTWLPKFPAGGLSLVLLPHNHGAAEARNIGNAKATTDLLFMLDADNVLEAGHVFRLRELMAREPGLDMVATGSCRFFSGPRSQAWTRKQSGWVYPAEVTLPIFLSRLDLPTSNGTVLFRKSLWQKVPHPEGLGALEAWTWGLQIMMAGARIKCVPDTWYWHRQGIESLWIRDSRTKNFNDMATEQIKPYLDRLHPDDAKYILAGHRWYTELNKRPLRLKETT